MNLDVIAEIVATSFNADRPALRRYSATVRLHAPDKYPTSKIIGYGVNADDATDNAIHKALRYELMHTGTETRISSRTLPNRYGAPYLDKADACRALANRMPAESQAYKDMIATAEWYERQYIAVRYDYLRNY